MLLTLGGSSFWSFAARNPYGLRVLLLGVSEQSRG